MSPRIHFFIGIARKAVVIHLKPTQKLLITAKPISIHHKLFKTCAKTAFHPARGMKYIVCAGQYGGMHRIRAFISGLRVFDLACRQ